MQQQIVRTEQLQPLIRTALSLVRKGLLLQDIVALSEGATMSALPDNAAGKPLRDRLLINHGLLIRECSNKLGSTEQYLRLAVNLPDETDQLVRALTAELSSMH